MRNRFALIALAVCVLAVAGAAQAQWGWFWKAGYNDYCPEGMPDFDQKQGGWTNPMGDWSHCGPVAALNSLWWFDSRYETSLDGPFDAVADNFPLLFQWVGLDDHNPAQVVPNVDNLAWYMDTNGISTGGGHSGTYVHDMAAGLQDYLDDTGLGRLSSDTMCWFEVTAQPDPSFGFICEEVRICHDVVLLLGFWQRDPAMPDQWRRLGGHYVTVAGVSPDTDDIAICDPYLDMMCWGHLPGHGPGMHNNTANVAHDIYMVQPFQFSEYGTPEWVIYGYPYDVDTPYGMMPVENFLGQNPSHHYMDPYPYYDPLWPVIVKIEYAVKVWPNGYLGGGRVLDWAGWHMWAIFEKTPWAWPDDFLVYRHFTGELLPVADAAVAPYDWLQLFIFGYGSTGYDMYPGAADPYLYPGYGYWVLTNVPGLRIIARYDLACGRCCWWKQGPIIVVDHEPVP